MNDSGLGSAEVTCAKRRRARVIWLRVALIARNLVEACEQACEEGAELPRDVAARVLAVADRARALAEDIDALARRQK